jgi:cytochrome oxidase Cu insertion factor (SCO1/SenC/PrrC family)
MTPPAVEGTPRVRAPEFPEHLDWINSGGRPISLAELRGKVVLLDFWTYG